ncbi:class I lanthipeptide [Lacinutrix neustonica]|uniref:Class I lanthipeptide n=1 Tax=Lacinutrix neustonica TaxID=2980107 RepID=A0A9E8MU80_9FLAO|nr:class I lanthipeptide [Lacinutrix neustonica]WAC01044.1 class I lanthipeptide [Lacinutrix neustonica]
MKTQNKKLDFSKNSVLELNDQQLTGVAGGGESVGVTISFHEVTSWYLPAFSLILEIG